MAVDKATVLPERPAVQTEIALHFDAWFRSLPLGHQAAIRSGVLVTIPMADVPADDEEFVVVRPPSAARQPDVDPWMAFNKRRAFPRAWGAMDFLCAFSQRFKDATGYAYTLRGGFVGDDYAKVYALRQRHGNETLLAAIEELMKDWKRKPRRLRTSSAPTIGVLFAYFNEIVGLMAKEERHGEQAEWQEPAHEDPEGGESGAELG